MKLYDQLDLSADEHVKYLQELPDEELEKQRQRWVNVQTIMEARAAITPDPMEEQLDQIVEMLVHAAPEHEVQIRDAHHAVCEAEGYIYLS